MNGNFYVFSFDGGLPTMSITKNGVVFSKGVVCRLNSPRYCVFLIDEEGKRIALKPCEKEEKNSHIFYNPKKNAIWSMKYTK